MSKTIDRDSAAVLTQGEEHERFVKSEGWQNVRKKLVHHIAELDSITDIPLQMPVQDRLVEYAARQSAIQKLLAFLQDVEGDAFKSQNMREQLIESREENEIVQFFN
jgi:hypothetical protein